MFAPYIQADGEVIISICLDDQSFIKILFALCQTYKAEQNFVSLLTFTTLNLKFIASSRISLPYIYI